MMVHAKSTPPEAPLEVPLVVPVELELEPPQPVARAQTRSDAERRESTIFIGMATSTKECSGDFADRRRSRELEGEALERDRPS
jgi:hypothetical protein